jgi:hypothetical protein
MEVLRAEFEFDPQLWSNQKIIVVARKINLDCQLVKLWLTNRVKQSYHKYTMPMIMTAEQVAQLEVRFDRR